MSCGKSFCARTWGGCGVSMGRSERNARSGRGEMAAGLLEITHICPGGGPFSAFFLFYLLFFLFRFFLFFPRFAKKRVLGVFGGFFAPWPGKGAPSAPPPFWCSGRRDGAKMIIFSTRLEYISPHTQRHRSAWCSHAPTMGPHSWVEN